MINQLAVIGATGAVGRIVLDQLHQRQFPCANLKLLASKRSAGKQVKFADKTMIVEEMTPESFEGVDLVIASTPDDVAAQCVPWAVERGAIVVDESAFFRMKPDVPLVIPEVNADAIADHKGVIASPNCSTTQMVVALKPIYDAFGIDRVVVSTYQAVSGAGIAANEELETSAKAILDSGSFAPEIFQHPIGFNLIPQIGSQKEAGYTSEELKMVYETRKIFNDDSIEINPTCVRVPVTIGHSESIYVETKNPIDIGRVMDMFNEAEGVSVVDDLDQQKYPMPTNSAGLDDVFVGRIRKDLSKPNALSFWCVSDNLRKGAATNAVQIAERLVELINSPVG